MGKKLELSCPRYGRHVTRIEQNGSYQCSIFNSIKNKSRSRSFHKISHPNIRDALFNISEILYRPTTEVTLQSYFILLQSVHR